MLEKIGNIDTKGFYKLVCITAMKPITKFCFGAESYLKGEIPDDNLGDILFIDFHPITPHINRVVNLTKLTISEWHYNTGHVVESVSSFDADEYWRNIQSISFSHLARSIR